MQRANVIAPQCSMGALDDAKRSQIIQASQTVAKYAEAYDPESAFEILSAKVAQAGAEKAQAAKVQEEEEHEAHEAQHQAERDQKRRDREMEQLSRNVSKAIGSAMRGGRSRHSPMERAIDEGGAQLVRGILGMLIK